jgi:hypothetical protein
MVGAKGIEPLRDLDLHALTGRCVCQLPPDPQAPSPTRVYHIAGLLSKMASALKIGRPRFIRAR